MIFAALCEAAGRGELLLADGGLCRFHRRKDGVVVVREILVLPAARGRGLGRRLVGEVRARHPGAPLLAKCPAALPANGFWRRLGFALSSEAGGLNTWRSPG